jgi:ABC-2 type transport system permease protein
MATRPPSTICRSSSSPAGSPASSAHQSPDDLLTPWQGYGVFAVWTALLLAIAAYLLQRRDA